MKFMRGFLGLSSLVLSCSMAFAAQPITTLTCSTPGGSALTIPSYAFTFNANSSGTLYFTVYTDLSSLNTLINDLIFSPNYSTCNFSGNSGLTLFGDALVDVDAAGASGGLQSPNGPQAFASATFSAKSLQVLGAAVAPANTKQLTAAEQAQALAAFKARGLALPK